MTEQKTDELASLVAGKFRYNKNMLCKEILDSEKKRFKILGFLLAG